MTTRKHHIDIEEGNEITRLSFKERYRIQLEMIQDHAFLIGSPLEEAARDWVETGLAKLFANHYLVQN